jgi:CHAD domain-containing protein
MKAIEEIEAKFDVDPDMPLPELSGSGPGVQAVEADPVELTATYYDTEGLRLLRQGVTLRRRRAAEEGGEDLWTLKLPSAGSAVAYSRKEISWPGDSESVPAEARDLVTGLAMGEQLRKVAVLVSCRRRVKLLSHEGEILAEVDDDTVRVPWPAETVFRQIEVELVAGDAGLLGEVENRLRREGARRGSDEPKLARALGGPPMPGAGVETSAGSTVTEVVSACLSSALRRILANDPGVRLDEDPEFVHQARVATRRLRSDLKTYGQFLDPVWVAATRAELRWLGSALGEVRDADVLGDRLRAHAGEADPADHQGFDELLAHLGEGREASLSKLQRVMASRRYISLLRGVEASASDPPLGDGVDRSAAAAEACGPLVGRAWKRMRRHVRSMGAHPSAAELHEARIRAKQVRYASEATTAVFGDEVRHLAGAAEHVQTVLGDHHDAVFAESWARSAAGSVGSAGILAAGEVVSLERARQADRRSKWPSAWKHLRKAASKAGDVIG